MRASFTSTISLKKTRMMGGGGGIHRTAPKKKQAGESERTGDGYVKTRQQGALSLP